MLIDDEPKKKLMRLEKNIKKISVVLLFALSAAPSFAQDLLARQAPVDRRAKVVDPIELQDLKVKEEHENPAADLYGDFDNKYVHKATPIPNHIKIDCRHFCMPTPSRVVTSNFGYRWGRQHKGLDIKVYIGDSIRCAWDGKVRIVRYEGAGYGKYIVVRHYNGLETIYGHLSAQLVHEGQEVKAGEVIGLGGNTGRSTGSHLHFETRLCGVAINPAIIFDFRHQDIVSNFFTYDEDKIDDMSAEATRLRGKVGNGGYSRAEVRGEVAEAKEDEPIMIGTPSEGGIHFVKRGETLESIARKRGVSVARLCQLNGFSKDTKLKPGQVIKFS